MRAAVKTVRSTCRSDGLENENSLDDGESVAFGSGGGCDASDGRSSLRATESFRTNTPDGRHDRVERGSRREGCQEVLKLKEEQKAVEDAIVQGMEV